MELERTDRGFEVVTHPVYPPEKEERSERLVQQSSIVGKYEDAFQRPGSSALWIGEHHHLNREQVAELTARLVNWLKTGRLSIDTTAAFGKIPRSVLGQGGAGGAASPPASATVEVRTESAADAAGFDPWASNPGARPMPHPGAPKL